MKKWMEKKPGGKHSGRHNFYYERDEYTGKIIDPKRRKTAPTVQGQSVKHSPVFVLDRQLVPGIKVTSDIISIFTPPEDTAPQTAKSSSTDFEKAEDQVKAYFDELHRVNQDLYNFVEEKNRTNQEVLRDFVEEKPTSPYRPS